MTSIEQPDAPAIHQADRSLPSSQQAVYQDDRPDFLMQSAGLYGMVPVVPALRVSAGQE